MVIYYSLHLLLYGNKVLNVFDLGLRRSRQSRSHYWNMGLWCTTGRVGIQVEETLEACHIHETVNDAKLLRGNERLGKTRDLFRKIRGIKGVFHAPMGTIKDRKAMNLKEVEDIKEWWQEYIELSKKNPMTQITMRVWSLTYCQTSWSMKSSGS